MPVLLCKQINAADLYSLVARFGLTINWVAESEAIPGSWFGESEAGLLTNQLFLRPDTPVHSALHEASHYICMDAYRRNNLNTNAGGDYAEENAVCYLQLILADFIPGFGRERAFNDMDEWGYTFRLGSSRAWFESDAEDARAWLREQKLIDTQYKPCWKLRI